MHRVRTVAAVAALALGGIATAWAAVPREIDDRIEARRDRHEGREARIALPRTASGTIDVPKLITELRAAITRGARDIRFRDAALSASEAATLRDLAERFGFDGVRIREQGHRVRVDFRDQERAEQREQREHANARAERDEGRTETRVDRGGNARPERTARAERVERAERPEKAERHERLERAERPERPARSGRH